MNFEIVSSYLVRGLKEWFEITIVDVISNATKWSIVEEVIVDWVAASKIAAAVVIGLSCFVYS